MARPFPIVNPKVRSGTSTGRNDPIEALDESAAAGCLWPVAKHYTLHNNNCKVGVLDWNYEFYAYENTQIHSVRISSSIGS